MDGYTATTMSIGRHAPVLEWCQKKMALDLFEASSFELHTLQKSNHDPIFSVALTERWFVLNRPKMGCCKIVFAVYSVKLCSYSANRPWKSNNHLMGKVRPYEATPGDLGPSVQLTDFVFKLVHVDVLDPKAKTFASKYKLALPTVV